jgi:hypothetical protein
MNLRARGVESDGALFFHPDYTVGSGFAPDQPLEQLADLWPKALHRR